MITWMQRHRTFMLGTIAVVFITFIGAGAVDWGGAGYGNKATSFGEVGDIALKGDDLNREFTSLYNYYNQQFGGQLNEEMARKMGLEDQALQQLIQKTQLLNLAQDFDIKVSDEEIAAQVVKMPYFQKDGSFDQATYKQALKNANLSIKNFEKSLKDDLTIQKVVTLMQSRLLEGESKILGLREAINDKIEYKILNANNLNVTIDEEALKNYWQLNQDAYQTEGTFDIQMIVQPIKEYENTQEEIKTYYDQHSLDFLDKNGAVALFEDIKEDVIAALNTKKSKDDANRLYIAWKKSELPSDITIKDQTFTDMIAPFDMEIVDEVKKLQEGELLKAVQIDDDNFAVIKLVRFTPPRNKTFQEAKDEVTPHYEAQLKTQKLQELAQQERETFKGTTTSYLTMDDAEHIKGLSPDEAREFLNAVFVSKTPTGEVVLSNEKMVLFRVVAQKLLIKPTKGTQDALDNQLLQQKEQARQMALFKELEGIYPAKMYE